MFAISVEKDSDHLEANRRQLSDTFAQDSPKLLRKIESAYRKVPYFQHVMRLVKWCLHYDNMNLIDFIQNPVTQICDHLNI